MLHESRKRKVKFRPPWCRPLNRVHDLENLNRGSSPKFSRKIGGKSVLGKSGLFGADWGLSRAYRGLVGADRAQCLCTSQPWRKSRIAPNFWPNWRLSGQAFVKSLFRFPRYECALMLQNCGSCGGSTTSMISGAVVCRTGAIAMVSVLFAPDTVSTWGTSAMTVPQAIAHMGMRTCTRAHTHTHTKYTHTHMHEQKLISIWISQTVPNYNTSISCLGD